MNADGWRRGDHGINFDLCEECAADAVLENDDARVVGSWTGYPAPLPKGPRSAEEVLAGMFELSAGATAEDFSGKKMSYATMYRGTEEWQIIKTEANGTESYRVMPGEAVLDTFEEAKRYVYGLACQEAPLTQQFGCKVARELDAFLDEFEVNHEFSKDGINVADFEYMHQWLTERLLDDMRPEEACHAAFLLDRIEERSRLRGLEETIRRNWQAAESIHAANETFTAAYAYSRETIAQKIRTSLKPITSASLRELLRLMPMDSFSQGICRTVAPVKATCARV